MRRVLPILIFCCVSIDSVFSQPQRISEIGFWASLVANGKINKKTFFGVMGRWRQASNFLIPDSYYFDFSVGYKVLPGLKLALHYAYNPTYLTEGYFRDVHQYYILAAYKYPVNKYLELNNRIIAQHATHLFFTDFLGDNHYKPYYRTDIRERLGMQVNLSAKSYIYADNEIMYTVSQDPVSFTRNRLYTGYATQLSSSVKAEFYFVLQSGFRRWKARNYDLYILGIDLNYKLPW